MKTMSIIIGTVLVLSLAACDREEGRIYTSRDEDECKTLLFTCAPGRVPFFDDDGCGCELSDDNDININRDIDRNNQEGIPPTGGDTYDRDPGEQNLDDDENDGNQIDEDPLDRNLQDIQDRRLRE
jgi:hypothetical protein